MSPPPNVQWTEPSTLLASVLVHELTAECSSRACVVLYNVNVIVCMLDVLRSQYRIVINVRYEVRFYVVVNLKPPRARLPGPRPACVLQPRHTATAPAPGECLRGLIIRERAPALH